VELVLLTVTISVSKTAVREVVRQQLPILRELVLRDKVTAVVYTHKKSTHHLTDYMPVAEVVTLKVAKSKIMVVTATITEHFLDHSTFLPGVLQSARVVVVEPEMMSVVLEEVLELVEEEEELMVSPGKLLIIVRAVVVVVPEAVAVTTAERGLRE
jgi:methanogenic corrinoid protein MtbC1